MRARCPSRYISPCAAENDSDTWPTWLTLMWVTAFSNSRIAELTQRAKRVVIEIAHISVTVRGRAEPHTCDPSRVLSTRNAGMGIDRTAHNGNRCTPGISMVLTTINGTKV